MMVFTIVEESKDCVFVARAILKMESIDELKLIWLNNQTVGGHVFMIILSVGVTKPNPYEVTNADNMCQITWKTL